MYRFQRILIGAILPIIIACLFYAVFFMVMQIYHDGKDSESSLMSLFGLSLLIFFYAFVFALVPAGIVSLIAEFSQALIKNCYVYYAFGSVLGLMAVFGMVVFGGANIHWLFVAVAVFCGFITAFILRIHYKKYTANK